jgi:hypothetical protein
MNSQLNAQLARVHSHELLHPAPRTRSTLRSALAAVRH